MCGRERNLREAAMVIREVSGDAEMRKVCEMNAREGVGMGRCVKGEGGAREGNISESVMR